MTALEYALWMVREGHLSIDDDGKIWRHAVLRRDVWRMIEPRRAESVGGKGYLRLVLQIDGRLRSIGAHRVVWVHHRGPIPNELQINHFDLGKQNNRLSNLELATGSRNIAHSYANGRRRPWSRATIWRNGRQRLTGEEKGAIRQERASGRLLREIAADYGISVGYVSRLSRRAT